MEIEKTIDGFLLFLSKEDPSKRLPSRTVLAEIINDVVKDFRMVRPTETSESELRLDRFLVYYSRTCPDESIVSRDVAREKIGN